MDRGIPTEATLREMREPGREMFYLVGTPKGRINKHEKKWLDLPWQQVRDSVQVKLYQHEGELYVLARSDGRQAKEIAMRRKRLVLGRVAIQTGCSIIGPARPSSLPAKSKRPITRLIVLSSLILQPLAAPFEDF